MKTKFMLRVFCATFVAVLFCAAANVSAQDAGVQAAQAAEGQSAAVSAFDRYHKLVEELMLAKKKPTSNLSGSAMAQIRKAFSAIDKKQQAEVRYMFDTRRDIYMLESDAAAGNLKDFEKNIPTLKKSVLVVINGEIEGILPPSIDLRNITAMIEDGAGVALANVKKNAWLKAEDSIKLYGKWASGGATIIETN